MTVDLFQSSIKKDDQLLDIIGSIEKGNQSQGKWIKFHQNVNCISRDEDVNNNSEESIINELF